MLSGPVVTVSTSNWLVCWVGLELSFMGLIPLLTQEGNKWFSLSSESSMKYFCIQAAGSGILLCGGILMFMVPGDGVLLYGLVFVLGLTLKLGGAPFHFWVPGVVAGLSWIPIFFVLSWQKLGPFLLLINMVENSKEVIPMVLLIGSATAFLGSIIGLNQTKIRPLLGASSISHSGWAMMSCVTGGFWLFFGVYCFSLFLFIFFSLMHESFMSGIMLLSMSGLPPFLMFLGKWTVLKSALIFSETLWYLIFPLLSSILSLFFYLKFFYSFWMDSSKSDLSKLVLVGSAGFISVLGIVLIMAI